MCICKYMHLHILVGQRLSEIHYLLTDAMHTHTHTHREMHTQSTPRVTLTIHEHLQIEPLDDSIIISYHLHTISVSIAMKTLQWQLRSSRKDSGSNCTWQ